jgi:hypothetical protein
MIFPYVVIATNQSMPSVTLAECAALERLASRLSEQTGVKIVVQEAIKTRKLSVFVRDRPLAEVLQLIAESHNWDMKKLDATSYLITRPTIVPAHNLAQASRTMKRILPKDIVNYYQDRHFAVVTEGERKSQFGLMFLATQKINEREQAALMKVVPKSNFNLGAVLGRVEGDMNKDRLYSLLFSPIAESCFEILNLPGFYYDLDNAVLTYTKNSATFSGVNPFSRVPFSMSTGVSYPK